MGMISCLRAGPLCRQGILGMVGKIYVLSEVTITITVYFTQVEEVKITIISKYVRFVWVDPE